MNRLIIKGQYFSVSEIVSGTCPFVPESEFETRVFGFIQKWFDPTTEFELSTSGSTGKPKKIRFSKKLMMQSAMLTAEALNLTSGMTAILAMDPKYIGGMMMIARSLTLEMDLWVVEPSSNPLSSLPKDVKIDFTALVPMQLNRIIDEEGIEKLNSIKVLLVGGGPVPKALESKISSLKVPVYQTYGMTETLSHVALKKLNGKDKSSSYKTLPGITIGKDNRGCLKISGAFLENEVVTNDIVEVISRNTFNWLGRYDNIINSGGIKLNPEQIEQEVTDIIHENNFGNFRFFLAGLPDDELGQRMVLFIEGHLKGREKELHQILKTSMEIYKCPKNIVEIDRFPLTETGKIKRTEIIRRYSDRL